jgi:branched-chain amino acid transport system substrate-binding protein
MAETKSTGSTKIVELFEKGMKFDLLKTRPGYFRASDHQVMHEMYAVTAVPPEQVKNQWDIFTSSPPFPGPDEDLEVIAATKDEAACTFA